MTPIYIAEWHDFDAALSYGPFDNS
jgi:hypothetical protein